MSGIKKVKEVIRLQVKAGEANPTPPLGPVLGSRGINLLNFCKQFNMESVKVSNLLKGTLVTVILTLFEDKSFSFTIKSPPTSYLIKKYLSVEKGYAERKKNVHDSIFLTIGDIKEIVKLKRKDLVTTTEEAAIKVISGSVLSMGFVIKEL